MNRPVRTVLVEIGSEGDEHARSIGLAIERFAEQMGWDLRGVAFVPPFAMPATSNDRPEINASPHTGGGGEPLEKAARIWEDVPPAEGSAYHRK